MGKPAARLGDLTAHGGTVMLGNPTIMMGKMPASTLGDMHVCPMCTGPVPHVGGPITLGSMGVLVGKKPSARISDMATCVGPPSMNALGCFTVLIGEAGSGSSAGSAGTAAEAQAAKKKGPKAIGAFPLGEPPGPTESHEIKVEFVDSAGKPLSGVFYAIEDPDKQNLRGVSTLDGAALHGGYAKKGSYTLTVKALSELKWEKAEAQMKDTVKFSAKADSFEDGTKAEVVIFEECGAHRRVLEVKQLKVQGGKISGDWVWKNIFLPPDSSEQNVDHPVYTFQIVSDGLVGVSGPLKLYEKLAIKASDGEGNAKKQFEYEIILATGEVLTGKLDDAGKTAVAKVSPGKHKVKLVDPKKKNKKDVAPAVKPKPKATAAFPGSEDSGEAAEEDAGQEKKKKTKNDGDKLITAEMIKIGNSHLSDNDCNNLLPFLNKYAKRYEVNNRIRIAHFLSQVGHESGFTATEEGTNYRENVMKEKFGSMKGGWNGTDCPPDKRKRLKLWENPSFYAHHGKNLMNYVYADRMGNGNEQSGDGYKYIGRGLIQLTGKENYRKYTDLHNAKNPEDKRDFVLSPELLITELEFSVESAFAWWSWNHVNNICINGSDEEIKAVTQVVNGGENGLKDRMSRYHKIISALKA